jgi:hypothetical protein
MHLAHVEFSKVPDKLDFKEIVRLAEVAERYGVNRLLVNNIDGWLAPYRDRLLEPGYEEWLFVAYQFGYESEYIELAKHLALRCRVTADGAWLFAPDANGDFGPLEGRFPGNTLGMSTYVPW